jgi:alpha-galactosidase
VIWAKPLSDGSRAIGIFNRADKENDVDVSWLELGFATRPAAVRDLWAHKNLPPSPAGWQRQLPPHGVLMLIIK